MRLWQDWIQLSIHTLHHLCPHLQNSFHYLWSEIIVRNDQRSLLIFLSTPTLSVVLSDEMGVELFLFVRVCETLPPSPWSFLDMNPQKCCFCESSGGLGMLGETWWNPWLSVRIVFECLIIKSYDNQTCDFTFEDLDYHDQWYFLKTQFKRIEYDSDNQINIST